MDHIGCFQEWMSVEMCTPDAASRRKHKLVNETLTLLREISEKRKVEYYSLTYSRQLVTKHRWLDHAASKAKKIIENFMKSWREERTKTAGRTTSERFLKWYFDMTKRLSLDTSFIDRMVQSTTHHDPHLKIVSQRLRDESDQIDDDVRALRSKFDEAKRLFDDDRNAAKISGQLAEFDQQPCAGEEKGWVKAKYAGDVWDAYQEFIQKYAYLLESRKFFAIAVEEGEIPDFFATIDARKKRWLSDDWKKCCKAELVQKLEQIEATQKEFWNPLLFLDHVMPGRGILRLNQSNVPPGTSNSISQHRDTPSHDGQRQSKQREKEETNTENNVNRVKIAVAKDNSPRSNNENEKSNHEEKVALQIDCSNDAGNMAKGESHGDESDNVNQNNKDLPSKSLRLCSSSHCGKAKLKSEVFVCAACAQHPSLPNSQPFEKAYYCNTTCQIADWKERHSVFHKKQIKEWKRLNRQCSYAACGQRAADNVDNAEATKLRVCEGCQYYASGGGFQKAYYCGEICRLADLEAGHAKIHEDLERKCQIAQQEMLEDVYDVD